MLNPSNHLNNNQWVAVGLVFVGLGGEIAGKYQAKNAKASKVGNKQWVMLLWISMMWEKIMENTPQQHQQQRKDLLIKKIISVFEY